MHPDMRIQPLEPRRLLAAAGFDPAFGVGGLRAETFPNDIGLVQFTAVQPDGKIIVKGILNSSNTEHISRYLADGSTDPSFTLDASLTSVGAISALPDGKLIAVVGPGLVARLNNNGSLDTTFGGTAHGSKAGTPAGISDIGFDSSFSIRQTEVGPDGQLVLLGKTGPADGDWENTLLVLNADGSPMTSFGGGDGIVQVPVNGASSWDDWQFVAFTQDGKIAIGEKADRYSNVGKTQGTSFIGFFRYNADGTLDNTFADNARFEWTLGQTGGVLLGMDVASDGSIIGVGGGVSGSEITYESGGLLFKSTPTGELDSTFSDDGILITNYKSGEFTSLYEVQNLGDGRFYVAGKLSRHNVSTLVVARYNPDGSLDTSFGGNAVGGGALRIPELHMQEPHLELAPDGGVFLANDAEVSDTDNHRLWNTRRLVGDSPIRLNGKGTLLIEGTTDADDVSITLRARDGRLVARINGYSRTFAPSKIKRIAAFTYGGNDVFNIGAGVKGGYCDGGDGNDSLFGGSGADVLLGGAGDDEILGADGDDTLLGGAGRDYLLGSAGKDDLFGEAGIDTLSGAGGNDRLFGGSGIDALYGGVGQDSAASDPQDAFDSIETMLA